MEIKKIIDEIKIISLAHKTFCGFDEDKAHLYIGLKSTKRVEKKFPNHWKGIPKLDSDITFFKFPSVDVVYYYCGCKTECTCDHFNLPMTYSDKPFVFYNNNSSRPVEINNAKQFKNYFKHSQQLLFMHRFPICFGLITYKAYLSARHLAEPSDLLFELRQNHKGKIVMDVFLPSANYKKYYAFNKQSARDLIGVVKRINFKISDARLVNQEQINYIKKISHRIMDSKLKIIYFM